MAETRSQIPLLIAFVNLARFAAQSQRSGDLELAEAIDAFYEHVAAAVGAGGGTVVEFVGDAALVAFPASTVDRGVETLLGPQMRTRFKKHTPPIMYIRTQDPRRLRAAAHG